jgi:hypothetical protein
MAKIYGNAENVESLAQRLIPKFHSELIDARIRYLFINEGSKKGGRPVLGKVRKISGALEFLLDTDFLIEIALDSWNDLSEQQRAALVDHLLERCYGEEDEKSGEMKWTVREPDVQEFSSILQRHGVWNENLTGFVSIAQTLKIDALVADVVSSAADDVTEDISSIN